jgi:hypothetical protein
MKTFSIRLSVLALFAIVTAVSLSPALAAGGDNPAPPAKGKKHDKSSRIDNPKVRAGYRNAYTAIYDKYAYAAVIDQLKALGHDERASVANLIAVPALVPARTEGRPESREDLAVLRPVAARTGQPRSGAIPFEQNCPACGHRQRRISFAGGRDGNAAGHRPRLLSRCYSNTRHEIKAGGMHA